MQTRRRAQAPVQSRVTARGALAAWWRRRPRLLVALSALFVALLAADALLYQVTLPVTVTANGAALTVNVGGAVVRTPTSARIVGVVVPSRDSVVHEFQLDDTDSTNNFTLDTNYLHSIQNTPYYRFYAWMRDLDGLSRWRDVCLSRTGAPTSACVAAPPLDGARIVTPQASTGAQWLTATIQRPETPLSLELQMSDGSLDIVTVDRNDRIVAIARSVAGEPAQQVASVYFPTDSAPFAAMVADFIVRMALWALVALATICAGEWLLGWLLSGLNMRLRSAPSDATPAPSAVVASGVRAWLLGRWRALTDAIAPLGLVALLASFLYIVWIALAQYHAEPHIYDASAYLFGAKILQLGRLWAPIPAAADRFNGPFTIMSHGKWFVQYEPGTSLMLAIGGWFGAAWLVEPTLGTLSLLGVGLIARRLYDRRVATLAVLLGALSPFYSYLASSYLSHTVALFFLVWGFWALLRALMDPPSPRGAWLLPLAGVCWLMAAFTRDTSIIFIAVASAGALWLGWFNAWPGVALDQARRWLLPGLALLGLFVVGLIAYYSYNAALTGSPIVTPRAAFAAYDHYGFGVGVGFYGQHTLASGLVNLDELLTSLAIDLFGWPFYLTLALLLIPFLARRARVADVVMLVGACALIFAFVGYFYPGIYLGPRYVFEALPFLLILTARGLLTLAEVGAEARAAGSAWGAAAADPRMVDVLAPRGVSLTAGLGLGLLACWGLLFLPRQVLLHNDFTGMASGVVIQTARLANPPLRHALVITGDNQLYGYTLFALNDPLLRGNVIYAEANSADQYAELHRAYPDRALYLLVVNPDSSVVYAPIQPESLGG